MTVPGASCRAVGRCGTSLYVVWSCSVVATCSDALLVSVSGGDAAHNVAMSPPQPRANLEMLQDAPVPLSPLDSPVPVVALPRRPIPAVPLPLRGPSAANHRNSTAPPASSTPSGPVLTHDPSRVPHYVTHPHATVPLGDVRRPSSEAPAHLYSYSRTAARHPPEVPGGRPGTGASVPPPYAVDSPLPVILPPFRLDLPGREGDGRP